MSAVTPHEDSDAFVAAFLMQRLVDRERGAEGSLDDIFPPDFAFRPRPDDSCDPTGRRA